MAGRMPKSKRLETQRRTKNEKRKKNKREKLCTWTSGSMALAINEYFAHKSNPNRLTLRGLSRAYGVPLATLHDRVAKMETKNETEISENTVKVKIGRKSMFSVEEETALADLLIDLGKRGFGLTRLDLRKLAYEYAEAKGIKGFSEKTKLAGYDWLQGFLERNRRISVRKPENISSARAMCMNKIVVKKHFDELQACLIRNGLISERSRIWNADETGLQDLFESEEVLASAKGRVFNVTSGEKGQTSTLLCAINANGDRSPALYIFKGVRCREEWHAAMRDGDIVRMSEKGWINSELMVQWGERFIGHLRSMKALDAPNLLLLDGHSTHTLNLNFINLMKNNEIILWAIPPHTSHYLQPLDKNVFASLKKEWHAEGMKATRENGARNLGKDELIKLLYSVMPKAFSKENITKGFQRTGLFPFNPNAIPDDAYLPSERTSRPLNEADDDTVNVASGTEVAETVQDSRITEPLSDGHARDIEGFKPQEVVKAFKDFLREMPNPRKAIKRKVAKSRTQEITSQQHLNYLIETQTKAKKSRAGKTKGVMQNAQAEINIATAAEVNKKKGTGQNQ